MSQLTTKNITNDAVTNPKLANMATQTIKGRTTAGTGDPEDLTATQATAILNSFVGDSGSGGTKGLVPAPATGDATKFLKGDGTWAAGASGITSINGDSSAAQSIVADSTGTDFTISTTGGITTVAIPSASATNRGLVTTGTQTFAGTKTFSSTITGTTSGNTTYTANNHGVVISGSGNAMTVIAPDASTIKVLTSGGTGADPSWQNVSPSALNVASKTANYTLTASDDLILANSSGGAFTLTLPTAAGITGKVYHIKKTDSTFATANAITIDGNGSETIDGDLTTTLNTQYESISIVSDGTNWQMLDRKIPSKWVSYTPSATWTTNTTVTGFWKRTGDSINGWIRIVLSGAPNNVTLDVDLPSGLTFDTAKLVNSGDGQDLQYGQVNIHDAGTAVYTGMALKYSDTNTLTPQSNNDDGNGFTTTARATDNSTQVTVTFASGDEVFIRYNNVPISGWNA